MQERTLKATWKQPRPRHAGGVTGKLFVPGASFSDRVRYQSGRCKEQAKNSGLRENLSRRQSEGSLSPTQPSRTTSPHGRRAPVQLTKRQKQLIVWGRLAQPDASELSDRGIARELGVSQPFVSKLRRRVARCPAAPWMPTGSQDVLGAGRRRSGVQEVDLAWLRRPSVSVVAEVGHCCTFDNPNGR